MPTTAVEIQGTLHDDGTLVLDRKPDLPSGRVKVTVRPTESVGTDVVSVLEQIHLELARQGHAGRSAEEIAADLAEMRDDGERTDAIERIQDECRRHRESGGGKGSG